MDELRITMGEKETVLENAGFDVAAEVQADTGNDGVPSKLEAHGEVNFTYKMRKAIYRAVKASIKQTARNRWRVRHERVRQVDKACYIKWKSAKRNHVVLKWSVLMFYKRTLRKIRKGARKGALHALNQLFKFKKGGFHSATNRRRQANASYKQ